MKSILIGEQRQNLKPFQNPNLSLKVSIKPGGISGLVPKPWFDQQVSMDLMNGTTAFVLGVLLRH